MRVMIVGAGAVGSYLAARFRLGGHDVVLLGRPEAKEALAAGVTLAAGTQEWPVSVDVASSVTDARLREPFELAIVAVKTFSTQQAIEDLRAIEGCVEATIMSVQNGVGSEELLMQAFGAERICAAALTTAVVRSGAVVTASDRGGLTFAPVGRSPHNWLIAASAGTGMTVRAASDWRALKWSKLCINLLANAVCAVLDWTPAQVYADATAFAAERACLAEALAVMQRVGLKPIGLVDFPVPVLAAAVRALSPPLLKMVLAGRVARARGEKLPSLLIDLRAGRRLTEVGQLNGAVAEKARGAGVPAPANDAVSRIVSGIAAGTIDWESFRDKPAALASVIFASAG